MTRNSRVSIGIIGTGWVGSSVAISTLHTGVAQEVLLYDRREEVAEGEAMDLSHGSSFYPRATVRSVHPRDMLGCDVVVIAAGRGGTSDESRLDLLRDNARIIREIASEFTEFEGTVVVVTNPVDVLTYEFRRASRLSTERVLGTGTMLDTARLRDSLGRELRTDPRSVHAMVVGEHGDSEVVVWSTAMLGGTPLRAWPGWDSSREREVEDEVRTAAYEIIKRKGATNHAIGLVTADLLRSIVRNERRIVTVSRVQEGAAGLNDVALSLPTVVGADGGFQVVTPKFDDEELGRLEHSADVLRTAIRSISE